MKRALFIRLTGPMQSWGTGSKFQIRRTDDVPSKSGVLGLVLCAMGVSRADAPSVLPELVALGMGVRIDRPGVPDWDYHTVGAGLGVRKAEGGVKRTASTKQYEVQLSRRQYLLDASFLVVLLGDEGDRFNRAADALRTPVWPVYLGRKCCIPSQPVFAGVGQHEDLKSALEAIPLMCEVPPAAGSTRDLDAAIECLAGEAPPPGARLIYDVPRRLQPPNHGPRWVSRCKVTARCERPAVSVRHDDHWRPIDYTSQQWKDIRTARLEFDDGLCVFCKGEAAEVHHVTYENVGQERKEDLRSLCRTCHDACTQLEYGHDMRATRMDPTDASQREAILRQIALIVNGRRVGRRRRVLERTRCAMTDPLDTHTE